MIAAKIDKRAFDLIFNDYLKFSKREISDSLNAKNYYIACNAANDTVKTTPQQIEADLRKGSNKYPEVPRAAIIINVKKGKKGKKGLTGHKMAEAVERYIRAKKRTASFISSGWKWAAMALKSVVRQKAGYKVRGDVKIYRTPKGGGKPASIVDSNTKNMLMVSSIWTNIREGHMNARLAKIMNEGLQKGLDRESYSMLQYIEQKLAKYKG
jgi:hypothetical protein